MLECEGEGKSIEKAIENALLELKAPREDVDIKIISEGGLFKKAKVLVSISEDVREKYENREARRKNLDLEDELEKVEETKEEVVEQPAAQEEVVEETTETQEEVKEETVEVEEVSGRTSGKQFLEGFVKTMGLDCEINLEEDEEVKRYKIEGDKASNLVGFRGECLNALQYITSILEGRGKRVVLDIDNYREKREQTLVALAHRMARKVAKTNHQVKLEPMTANERRIIHTALQSDTFVTTFSKGTEPNRYLVIIPKSQMPNND